MSYAKQTLAISRRLPWTELMNLGMDQEAGAQAVAKEIGRPAYPCPAGEDRSSPPIS